MTRTRDKVHVTVCVVVRKPYCHLVILSQAQASKRSCAQLIKPLIAHAGFGGSSLFRMTP